MQSLLPVFRRVLAAANGVVVFDDRFDAQARRFFRSPFRSFCIGALLGAMLGATGALVAPEMFFPLALMFAVYCGLLGAAMSGVCRREISGASVSCVHLPYGPCTERKLRRAKLAFAAVPTAICLAVALLSEQPLLVFFLFSAVLLLLIAVVGIVALLVELISFVIKFSRAAKFSRPSTDK